MSTAGKNNVTDSIIITSGFAGAVNKYPVFEANITPMSGKASGDYYCSVTKLDPNNTNERILLTESEKKLLKFYSPLQETNLANDQFRKKEAFYDTCLVEGDLQSTGYSYNLTYYYEKEGHNRTDLANRITIGLWIVYRKSSAIK